MKMNKILVIAMAAIVAGFASCAKDNDPGANGKGGQTLSIQLSGNETRSIDSPLAGTTAPVTFSGGELFLVDGSGKIEYIYKFTTATNLTNKELGITDATSADGVTITGIKASVKKAYIVGNSSAITGTAYAIAAVEGNNISGVKAVVLTQAMEYSALNKNLAGVTLYGEGEIENDTVKFPGDDTKKFVQIDLRPHVARLEVGGVKAVPTSDTPAVAITEFNVDGIFVNNFYPTISIDWITRGTIVNPGQGDGDTYGDNKTVYTTPGVLHDYSATHFGNTATVLTKYPNGTDATKVWAYNLLATPVFGTGTFQNAITYAPHIIVAINGVVADNGQDYSGDKFLTVNKLMKSDGITEITHFEAGKIYTIDAADFTFTVKNIHDDAEIEPIDLRVKVTQIGWTTEPMKPVLQ